MSRRYLIEQYIEGWKDSNLEIITKCLSSDCVITESHGPVYKGINQIREWVSTWTQVGIVKKWDIINYYEYDDNIFFEWDFLCVINGQSHDFLGASIVKITQDKISEIREYRMTGKPHSAAQKE